MVLKQNTLTNREKRECWFEQYIDNEEYTNKQLSGTLVKVLNSRLLYAANTSIEIGISVTDLHDIYLHFTEITQGEKWAHEKNWEADNTWDDPRCFIHLLENLFCGIVEKHNNIEFQSATRFDIFDCLYVNYEYDHDNAHFICQQYDVSENKVMRLYNQYLTQEKSDTEKLFDKEILYRYIIDTLLDPYSLSCRNTILGNGSTKNNYKNPYIKKWQLIRALYQKLLSVDADDVTLSEFNQAISSLSDYKKTKKGDL